jgi:hypothetical protein
MVTHAHERGVGSAKPTRIIKRGNARFASSLATSFWLLSTAPRPEQVNDFASEPRNGRGNLQDNWVLHLFLACSYSGNSDSDWYLDVLG